MKGIKFYLRCMRWLWVNREWGYSRQKMKAMVKECSKELRVRK